MWPVLIYGSEKGYFSSQICDISEADLETLQKTLFAKNPPGNHWAKYIFYKVESSQIFSGNRFLGHVQLYGREAPSKSLKSLSMLIRQPA